MLVGHTAVVGRQVCCLVIRWGIYLVASDRLLKMYVIMSQKIKTIFLFILLFYYYILIKYGGLFTSFNASTAIPKI